MYTEKSFYRKVETSNVLFPNIINTKGLLGELPLRSRCPQQMAPGSSQLKEMGPIHPPLHTGQWKEALWLGSIAKSSKCDIRVWRAC